MRQVFTHSVLQLFVLPEKSNENPIHFSGCSPRISNEANAGIRFRQKTQICSTTATNVINTLKMNFVI